MADFDILQVFENEAEVKRHARAHSIKIVV